MSIQVHFLLLLFGSINHLSQNCYTNEKVVIAEVTTEVIVITSAV